MSGAALAALLALVPLGLEVTGDATCPAPAEVARRLEGLIPTTSEAPAPGAPAARVIVTRNGPAMRLVLLGLNANELATRELPLEGTCDDLASAAAVVVAAWQADLNPDLAPPVTLPATPASASATPPIAIARDASPPPRAPTPFAIGLGLMTSETGGDFAAGAMLVGALGLGRRGLALDGGLSATTSHSAAVGSISGGASWSRTTLALGPAFRLGHARVRGDLHLQALAALLRVRGVGVPNPASDTTVEVGVGAGARIDLVAGTSTVWMGLDALEWPGDQQLTITNDPFDFGELPRTEVIASFGIGFGYFP